MTKLNLEQRNALKTILEVCAQSVSSLQCPYFQYKSGMVKKFGSCVTGCFSEEICVSDGDIIDHFSVLRDFAESALEVLDYNNKSE